MPNWCETTYKIVGNKEDLQSLYNILEEMHSSNKSVVENGYGNMWLGNLVGKLGYNWEDYPCRGEIIDYDFDTAKDVLTIWQDTAWNEQEGVRQAITEKYPSLKVYFMEEEPGCVVYFTNDTTGEYFPDNYILEYDGGHEYFQTIQELVNFLKREFNIDVNPTDEDIENALEELEEKERETNEDAFFSLRKFIRDDNC